MSGYFPLPLRLLSQVGDESDWTALPQVRFRPTHIIVTTGTTDTRAMRLILVGEALMTVITPGMTHAPADEKDRCYDLSALEPRAPGQFRLPDGIGSQWAARIIFLRMRGVPRRGTVVLLGLSADDAGDPKVS